MTGPSGAPLGPVMLRMSVYPLSIIADDMLPKTRPVALCQFGRPLKVATEPRQAPAVGITEARPRSPGDECRAAMLTIRTLVRRYVWYW